MDALPRLERYLLISTVFISATFLTGCVESTFVLAPESELPRSVTLPPGLTRTDVSVTLNLYAPLRGPDAKFVVRDKRGKKLAEVKGKTIEGNLSRTCRILTGNGVTETINLKPYREHDNMEQNGRAIALFYVIDDDASPSESSEKMRNN